ncbi:MAG: hypothetical protein NC253_08120 [Ruminococcus sp.]|nr:hypothetical protein [Ruminococcus sp.]MCM1382020.1 hypothetical protein [Muribaculaceae bacterium]MCM1479380.1 hypothetical protein [Muribaculaceae bacterium]
MKITEIDYSVSSMFIMTAIISFLGFALENIWLAARKGYMDNRNMFAPFLLGYGAAVMGLYLLLGTPGNPRTYINDINVEIENNVGVRIAAYFAITFVCVSLGEIVLGKIIEKTCHIYLWDYTSIPLHITRYTSVPTSIGFTVIITVFTDCFFERIMDALMRLDPVFSNVLGVSLMAVMTADFIFNAARTMRTHSMMTSWRFDIPERSFRRYKFDGR